MADAIVLKKIRKTFGETVAVRNLDLTVSQGAMYGLIGPNGAGKTTMIRMILSILFPDQGEMTVLGHSTALAAKDRIGYMPEERGLYKKMRVGDFLAYIAKLKGMNPSSASKEVRSWLKRVDLSSSENNRCEELSKGMQQKVQFIATAIHRPDLLILDEPFSGLDPVSQRLLSNLVLEENRRGATVLFSTHVMIHAEQLCGHIVMIHRGEKVLDRSMADIRKSYDPRRIAFEPLDPSADVNSLHSLPGVQEVDHNGASWNIALADGASPASVIHSIVAAITPLRIEVQRPTLEDIFIDIVKKGDSPQDDGVKLRAALGNNANGQETKC